MKSAGIARSNGLYRHIRTSKEIIRNLLNDYSKFLQIDKTLVCSCNILKMSVSAKMPVLRYALLKEIFTELRVLR